MKNLISGILAVALVAGPASAQQVTTKLPSATVKLNGASGGGSGDITAVDIATTSPLTGGTTCATGACSFTLGLTGGTLSGLTATKLPVATSATAVGDSAITHDSTTGVTTFGGSGPKLVFAPAGTPAILLKYDSGLGGIAVRDGTDSALGRIDASAMVANTFYGVNLLVLSSVSVSSNTYDGTGGLRGPSGMTITWNSADTQLKRDAAAQVGVYGSGSTYGQLNAGTVSAYHYLGRGSTPTIGGSCGTSPAVAGGDSFISVTTGSGSPTSCVVTFALAYSTAPVCNANASATTTALNVATTTTTVTVSAAALTAAEVLHISCGGF